MAGLFRRAAKGLAKIIKKDSKRAMLPRDEYVPAYLRKNPKTGEKFGKQLERGNRWDVAGKRLAEKRAAKLRSKRKKMSSKGTIWAQ